MAFGTKNEDYEIIVPMDKKDYANIQLITAAILAIGGMVLLYCGAYIDPQGEIHESLLVAFGEVMTFAGSLFGIDYYYKQRTHGKE